MTEWNFPQVTRTQGQLLEVMLSGASLQTAIGELDLKPETVADWRSLNKDLDYLIEQVEKLQNEIGGGDVWTKYLADINRASVLIVVQATIDKARSANLPDPELGEE